MKEFSYDQATPMILYLADTYGIDKVFQAYTTQNVNAVFGKGFEGLKAEWLVYLNN